jgi:pimeloyl-ACP methyl ester carboxylesterase
MPKTQINGINMYYEIHGSGYPLIMMTGFTGTTRMWDSQIAALSKEYQLIIFDMRGHGQTEAPRDHTSYSNDILVEDEYQLLQHLGINKAIIGGLSLGGLVGMWFYLKHPEMTRALVLADTGPGYRNPETRKAFAKDREKLTELLIKDGMEAFLRSKYSVDDYYTTPDIMRTLDPIGIAFINKGVLTDVPPVPLEEIKGPPTLIICGEQDASMMPASHVMSNRIQGSELVIIPQAGHGANVDQPLLFNQAILDFLKRQNL